MTQPPSFSRPQVHIYQLIYIITDWIGYRSQDMRQLQGYLYLSRIRFLRAYYVGENMRIRLTSIILLTSLDCPIEDSVSELGIPAKLVKLCRTTLSNTRSSVQVGKDFSDLPRQVFDILRPLRHPHGERYVEGYYLQS